MVVCLLIFIILLGPQLFFTLVQFEDVLISSVPFCLSLLRAAHTVRWLAQLWAATVKAVHFAITTFVLLKQVSGCIKYRHTVKSGVKHKYISVCSIDSVSLPFRLLSE